MFDYSPVSFDSKFQIIFEFYIKLEYFHEISKTRNLVAFFTKSQNTFTNTIPGEDGN